ncbi:MAG: hypothetical protein Q9226_002187 [Calogaya cf. arnoldii]
MEMGRATGDHKPAPPGPAFGWKSLDDETEAFKPSLDPKFSKNRPEQPRVVNEPVHGMLDKLPGCITVTSGPQDAKGPNMNCANGRKARSLVYEWLATIPGPSVVKGSPKPHHPLLRGTNTGDRNNKSGPSKAEITSIAIKTRNGRQLMLHL